VAVTGNFERGDPVEVCDAAAKVLGRGLCAYSADDLRCIAGHRSEQIEALLGWRGRDEAIHRDDLVVFAADDGGA
jgi:glutamate 5-kinase